MDLSQGLMGRPKWWRHRLYSVALQIQLAQPRVISKRLFANVMDLVVRKQEFDQVLKSYQGRRIDPFDFVVCKIQSSDSRVYIAGYVCEVPLAEVNMETIYSRDHHE